MCVEKMGDGVSASNRERERERDEEEGGEKL